MLKNINYLVKKMYVIVILQFKKTDKEIIE